MLSLSSKAYNFFKRKSICFLLVFGFHNHVFSPIFCCCNFGSKSCILVFYPQQWLLYFPKKMENTVKKAFVFLMEWACLNWLAVCKGVKVLFIRLRLAKFTFLGIELSWAVTIYKTLKQWLSWVELWQYINPLSNDGLHLLD